MFLLIAFAFLAGIVTVLSPCILPLLPIILSSADGSGKQKPLGVVLGFIGSFTFFTLFLSTIVKLSGIPAGSLRFVSIIILAVFGASLLIPQIQTELEKLFSRFANLVPSGQKRTGFGGGLLIGLSLGLLWTPCVGPILASVISLAITGTVTAQAFIVTFSYTLGTAIPLFIIMMAGSTALQKVPWLVRNTSRIQKSFGVLMILTAVAIFFNLDRSFQTFIINAFPNYGTNLTKFEDTEKIQSQLKRVGVKGALAPELIVGGQWFNSEPLKLADLKGKVVLVDFWTYSCINCQRTLPYLRDWWEKYQDDGLVIIGVHAPEFEFEKVAKNVQRAIADFGLTYPVMQDNDYATWRAYDNHYWPAKYLIDKDGMVRYNHFGEGKYDETEKMIQQLLKEAGSQVSETISNQEYAIQSKTPELYLGSSRIQHFSSPEKIVPDQPMTYSSPKILPINSFAYEGNWSVMPEYAAPSTGAKLQLKFEAGDVYLVARPKNGSGQLKVLVDGEVQFPGEDNHDGLVTVDTDRLYKLVKLPNAGKHQLTIEFMDNNVEVYAFTFG
ncbi:MAG: hypothetical protein COY80_02020 [Candidatus Pacebacteria bacterium CG_4_10_14_0_8_um_filter_42_14]|nr:MAG: hypothetical protein COY80_02020 [Candidatus Pacebacteria bacterium CG_4_10_14_0_8_um_filter_42_14]